MLTNQKHFFYRTRAFTESPCVLLQMRAFAVNKYYFTFVGYSTCPVSKQSQITAAKSRLNKYTRRCVWRNGPRQKHSCSVNKWLNFYYFHFLLSSSFHFKFLLAYSKTLQIAQLHRTKWWQKWQALTRHQLRRYYVTLWVIE